LLQEKQSLLSFFFSVPFLLTKENPDLLLFRSGDGDGLLGGSDGLLLPGGVVDPNGVAGLPAPEPHGCGDLDLEGNSLALRWRLVVTIFFLKLCQNFVK
jgi:hypothetical protein